MDLIDFINKYWTILAGILSFVTTIIYAQNEIKNTKKDMVTQKEAHDAAIADLKTQHTTLETRFNENKDKIADSISSIQGDIKSINTKLDLLIDKKIQ